MARRSNVTSEKATSLVDFLLTRATSAPKVGLVRATQTTRPTGRHYEFLRGRSVSAFDVLTSWVAWPVHAALAVALITVIIERKL